MSDLTEFRDHCRRMSGEPHRADCSAIVEGGGWGPCEVRPDPTCPPPGCATLAERALFARLADEVDAYMGTGPDGQLELLP